MGALSEKDQKRIEDACFAIIGLQGLSMPASLLMEQLPAEIAKQTDSAALTLALRRSSLLTETSPGMFKASPRRPDVPASPDYAAIPRVAVGSNIEELLHDNPPLPADVQLRLFKRLAAIRLAISFADRLTGISKLGNEVTRLLDAMPEFARWSTHDLVKHAEGSAHWTAQSAESVVAQERRRQLFTSIYGCDLLERMTLEELGGELQQLKDRLITSNLRLVSHFTRPHARGGFMWYSDLFQEAVIGLIRAVDRYDPYRGYQFSTYATWWIRQSVTRALADQERTIRIPVHMLEKLARIRIDLDGSPASDEVQGKVVTAERDLLLVDRKLTSLNGVASVIGSDEELAEELGRCELRITISDLLRQLPQRERLVLELRFGTDGGKEATLQEIAGELGLTRERIRQVERLALSNLELLWEQSFWTDPEAGTHHEKRSVRQGHGGSSATVTSDPVFAGDWDPNQGWRPAPHSMSQNQRTYVNKTRALLIHAAGGGAGRYLLVSPIA
jgi:RNA polymerase primary sigma factor/RNA polymerase nonessential primary-like sigma factor